VIEACPPWTASIEAEEEDHMHRSRLCTIMIDCSEETMAAGVAFWSGALGMEAVHSDDPTDPYVALEGDADGLRVELQRIGDASRIHLDIETDDVEAEVRRLEALGARRKAQIETWWIMQAPSGHLFCVVPQQTSALSASGHIWDG
jgi:hypothetical protein